MSKARSLANRSNDFVSVMDFNTASTPVDPTGATDSTAALAAVKTFCSSSSTPVRVIFPAGTYKYSTSPNWAINNLELVAEGLVLFQYTGTGDAFICDANVFGSGGGITGMKVGRFIIQAPSTAGCGALIRSIHHSYFELTVKGCGVGTWGTAIGINVLGCVCTEFYKPTVNIYDVYNGWYLSAAPSVGMYFGTSTYYGASASNIVKNPIIENFTGIGIHIVTGQLQPVLWWNMRVHHWHGVPDRIWMQWQRVIRHGFRGQYRVGCAVVLLLHLHHRLSVDRVWRDIGQHYLPDWGAAQRSERLHPESGGF